MQIYLIINSALILLSGAVQCELALLVSIHIFCWCIGNGKYLLLSNLDSVSFLFNILGGIAVTLSNMIYNTSTCTYPCIYMFLGIHLLCIAGSIYYKNIPPQYKQ